MNKGQLLASIDDGGLEQQVSQLEMQANLLRPLLKSKAALGSEIGSEMAYLQAKSNYEAQNEAVEQLKLNWTKH